MKVVLDGFPVRVGSAGIGTYTRELLGALARIAPENEYYLSDTGPLLSESRVPGALAPGDRARWLDALASRTPLAWKALPEPIRRWITARQAARLGAAAFLGTNYLGVFHRSFRTVVTIHDLAHVHDPEQAYPPMARKLARHLRRHAERADAILADSESTKRDIVTHFGLSPARIQVTYPGVSTRFRPVADGHEREACRRRYGLPERFLLHVGTVEPRKNLVRLVEAFDGLADHEGDLGLVLVGAKGWRDDAIVRAVKQSTRRDRIVVTGRVPLEDLPALYSLAELFVFPSLYEGFGLPVLEAMACGTPVVASHASSLPEVAGDAAVLVDPESVPQIAAAITRVLRDDALAASLQRRGPARAAAFTWDAAATGVLELLERLNR